MGKAFRLSRACDGHSLRLPVTSASKIAAIRTMFEQERRGGGGGEAPGGIQDAPTAARPAR